jgi:hypothetical protein
MAASSPCPLLPSRHRRRSHGDGSRNSRGHRSNSALFTHHTEKFYFRFASPAPPSTLDGIKALIADAAAISSVWIADCLYLSAIQRLAPAAGVRHFLSLTSVAAVVGSAFQFAMSV